MSQILEDYDPALEGTPNPPPPVFRRSRLKAFQLKIAVWFLRAFGGLDAIDARAEAAVNTSLDDRVLDAINDSDLSRRNYTLQMAVEENTKKVEAFDVFMRKNFKGFRAEISNMGVVIAEQRDEIGQLRAQISVVSDVVAHELTEMKRMGLGNIDLYKGNGTIPASAVRSKRKRSK